MTRVTQLPQAPSRGSAPSQFIVRADAFVSALPRLVSEINSVADEVNANADRAQMHAETAVQTSGASAWVSGTTYSVNQVAISQINFQTYRRKINGVSSVDPANDPTGWASLSLSGSIVGISMVRGLRGETSGGNNSDITFSAEEVSLRNADGGIVVRRNTGNITCSIDEAGPAVNARDQSNSFPVGFIHFYFIWNGSTLGVIASLNGPSVGPNLPSGYTHWAYMTSMYCASATQNNVRHVLVRGKKVYFKSTVLFDISSISGGVTTHDLSANILPDTALEVFGYIRASLTSNANGPATCRIQLYAGTSIAGGNSYQMAMNTGGASMTSEQQLFFEHANQVRALRSAKTGVNGNVATLAAYVEIQGYSVSNGDS